MKNRVVLVAVGFGIAWCYAEALIYSIGIASAQALPGWWKHIFTSHAGAALTWMVLCHTTAVLLVATAFGYVIARFYGRLGIALAVVLTVGLYAMDPLPSVIAYFHFYSLHMKVVTLFDAAKLVGMLPALVWMFSRSGSNYRMERTVTDKAPSSSVGTAGAHAGR